MTVTSAGVVRKQITYADDDGVGAHIEARHNASIQYDASGKPVQVALNRIGDETSDAQGTA